MNTLGIRPPGSGPGGGDILIGGPLEADVTVQTLQADTGPALSANISAVALEANVTRQLTAEANSPEATAEI